MLRFVKLIVHIAGITLYVELEEGCVPFFEDSFIYINILKIYCCTLQVERCKLEIELEEGCVPFFEDSCGFSRLPHSDNPSHAKKTNVKLLLVLSEQVDQKPRGEDDQHETIFHSVKTL